MGIENIFNKKQLSLFPKIRTKIQNEEEKLQKAFKFNYSSDNSTNVYYFFPMLFFNSQINLPEDTLIEYISAGIMYYEYIIAFDRKLDEQSTNDIGTLFYFSLLSQRSIEKLGNLFGDKSNLYFGYMHRYVLEYTEAIIIEKNDPNYYNDAKLRNKVLKGKAAIAKCFSTGVAILSNQNDEIAILDELQDYFNIAYQLFDDFKDIKEDIKSNQKNWINADCFNVKDNKVYEQLFHSGKLSEIFEQIVFYCNKSISLAGKYPIWIKNVRCFLEKVNRMYEDLTGNHIGIITMNVNSNISACKEKMIDFFKKVYINDRFAEASHYMNFRHEDGYCSKVEQTGNIFVKTELINILCSCNNDIFFSDVRTQWQSELWNYKTRWFKCGWSYFPNLLELAPDVDDLAEIMRLYSNDEVARNYMIECINFVINNCIRENGSIDTWMISKENLNEYETRAKKEAELRWQIRQDIEVVANFLYSLSFYKNDISNYHEICQKGYEYLISQKSKEGIWKSTWYFGNLYGTYMCMNFFKTLGDKTEDLKEIVRTILQCFNESGEYIYSGNLNDYALAIIIILETINFAENLDMVKKIISTAQKFFPTVIDDTGFCCAMPFIRLGTIKLFGKVNGKEVEYIYDNLFESQLLTSSLVLKCITELEKF